MLKDLGRFLRDVFKSTWAWFAVINGLVGFASRVVTDLGRAGSYISAVFPYLAVGCLAIGIFQVYRKQAREMERLNDLVSDRQNYFSVLTGKLRGEVRDNVEHLREGGLMLHDDAWRAFGPQDLKLLPRDVQQTASEFYRDLRSLKKVWEAPRQPATDPRKSAFERRKALDRSVAQKGRELLALLENVR